jgi:hypothetical protein
MSDAFSAIMIVGAFVLPRITLGMTDASTTRSPSTPSTRSSGVIARLHDALDVLPDVSIPVEGRHEVRLAGHITKRCLLGHVHRRANPLDDALPILLSRKGIVEDGLASGRALRSDTLPLLVGFSRQLPIENAWSNGALRPSS